MKTDFIVYRAIFSVSNINVGRFAILLAVTMQAIGKVIYGTWLTSVPSSFFVFISFSLTATFFILITRAAIRPSNLKLLLLLNVSTAITFLCFFFALKNIEAAIVGAMEIGLGPIIAIVIAKFWIGQSPTVMKCSISIGIALGCSILALAAIDGHGFNMPDANPWLGLIASTVAGIGAVLITVTSKELIIKGWTFSEVLAHRFYIIVPLSLALSLGSDINIETWSWKFTSIVVITSIVGVLLPLYLLLVGISKCDPYTVMVTMSVLPIITFLLEGFSPAYSWTFLTAIGLSVVFVFVSLDIFEDKLSILSLKFRELMR